MKNPFNQKNPFEEVSPKPPKIRNTRSRPSYKGISRIDSEQSHTYGWYVRVRRNGKVKSRFFSDQKYGGITKALLKARRYYKNEMREMFAQTLGEAPKHIPDKVIVTRNKKNNTGVIGVQKIERENPGGSLYRAFRVCWIEKSGKAKTRFFSINKYGEERAFELACQVRKEKLLEE